MTLGHISFVFFVSGIIFAIRGPSLFFAQGDVQGDILSPASVHIAENNPVTLTCSYDRTDVTACQWSLTDKMNYFISNDCRDVGIPKVNTTLYSYQCTGSFTWTINQVTRINDGDRWRCEIFKTNGENIISNSVQIYVEVPVQSVTMTSPTGNMVTVREKTETVFVCITSGGLPAPSVRWYKNQRTTATSDNVDITASASITTSKTNDDLVSVTSTLRYSPQKVDNGVKIYCTANNSDITLTSTRQPQLNVQYSPDSLPKIENLNYGDTYNVLENKPGKLSCSIQGGNPLATLSWNCYNTGLASVIDGNTVIKNVTWTATRNQDRSCTCQSSHVIAGNQSVSVSVNILYGPDEPVFKVSGRHVSRSVRFIEGKTRNVVCEGNGNPTANVYRWIKGENNISYTQTLTFNGVKRSNEGQYSCKVQNTMTPTEGRQETGRNSSDVNIIVLFAPSSPSFYYGSLNGPQVTGNAIDVIRGDTFNIACKYDGQPEPTYKWSGQTSNNHILTVTSIHETDNLRRTCTVTNTMQETYGISEQGSAHSQLTFNVKYPPQIDACKLRYLDGSPVNVNGLVTVIEGSSFSLTCTATSKPAVDSYSWAGPVLSSSDTLTLTTVSKQQNGTYTLTARNTMTRTFGHVTTGVDTKTISVDILNGPEVGRLSDKDIEAGSALNISCPVVKGNPSDTTFRWSRSKDNLVWNDQTLFIRNVSKHDDMVYTCRVQNTMIPTGAEQQIGEDAGSFHLNVLYEPVISAFFIKGHENEEQQLVTVNEHDEVIFTCDVDSNPAPTIEIIHDNRVLVEQTKTKSLSFILNNVACLQAGVYACEARNKAGKAASKNVMMHARCSPRPLYQIKHNTTGTRNNNVTLSFTALAYPEPGPTGFSWHKEFGTRWIPLLSNADLQISSNGVQTNLTILNVSQQDFGQYRITVTNEIGRYEQYLFLIEESSRNGAECKDNSNNTAMIVGVILGLTSGILATYAICVTIYLKRNVTNEGRQPTSKKNDKRTYINMSFDESNLTGQRNRRHNMADTSNEEMEDAIHQYTELGQYRENNATPYEVIEQVK